MLKAIVLVTLMLSAIPATASGGVSSRQEARPAACPTAHQGLRYYVQRASYWRSKMGAAPVRHLAVVRTATASCPRYLASVWRLKARSTRKEYGQYVIRERQQRAAERRSLYAKWECIHEHEGAWDSNTGNGYYGGLQMDIDFQLAHGRQFYERWGTADKWPVWAQLAAAEDAYRTRGFGPWPNTAAACGLL
jgi:Transglycosylase-like domain